MKSGITFIFLSYLITFISPASANSTESLLVEDNDDRLDLNIFEEVNNSTMAYEDNDSGDITATNGTSVLPGEEDQADYEYEVPKVLYIKAPDYELSVDEYESEAPRAEPLVQVENRSWMEKIVPEKDFVNETIDELERRDEIDEPEEDTPEEFQSTPTEEIPKGTSEPKPAEEDTKRKKSGKKMSDKEKNALIGYDWKIKCCVYGKRTGNARRTYMAENLFTECRKKTTRTAKFSKQCKWIYWSCCDDRALRRFYVKRQKNVYDYRGCLHDRMPRLQKK